MKQDEEAMDEVGAVRGDEGRSRSKRGNGRGKGRRQHKYVKKNKGIEWKKEGVK